MAETPGDLELARQAAYNRECKAYGYAGKSLQWQMGFDRGFKEAWKAAVDCTVKRLEVAADASSGDEVSRAA